MSNKEQVLSRCKAVIQAGGKCPESGVYVYWHMDFYELCYDGAKMYVNADGTGDGFEAAAKWLGLHNPWRLTSEELPERGQWVLAQYPSQERPIIIRYYSPSEWFGNSHSYNPPTHWMPFPETPIPFKPE